MRAIVSIVLLVVGAALQAHAQITLTAAGYPASLIGTDSLKQTTYTSSFPLLVAAANGTWDMSLTTDTTPVFFACRVPVPTYQYGDSNQYFLGSFAFQGNAPVSVTSLGLLEYGINVKGASYSLTTITLGPTDTLYIPAQNVLNTSPLVRISFPATYGSFWQSVYQTDVAFQLSVAAYALSHEPGFVRTYTTQKDTVAGWGKMRVKNAAGAPSDYFEVLQVRSTTITTDSFFLSGAPASPALLLVLGLTQGQQDTAYTQHYYRVGEVTPLAKVEFKDPAFTQPRKATMHMQRLVVSVNEISSQDGFAIYPNPASKILFIETPVLNKEYHYDLTDISGRKVQHGVLAASSGERTITLSQNVPAGTYYIYLLSDERIVNTSAIVIAE